MKTYKITQCTEKRFVGMLVAPDDSRIHIEGGHYNVVKVTTLYGETVFDCTNLIFHTQEV